MNEKNAAAASFKSSRTHILPAGIELLEYKLSADAEAPVLSFSKHSFQKTESVSFPLGSEITPSQFALPHRHDYFELMVVFSGQIRVHVEDEMLVLSEGDIYLLNRNVLHFEEYAETFHVGYFCISASYAAIFPASLQESSLKPCRIMRFFLRNLSDTANQNKEYLLLKPVYPAASAAKAKEIWNLLAREITEKQPGYELFILGWLGRFFARMGDRTYYKTKLNNLGTVSKKDMAEEILYYIQSRKRRVTREEIAAAMAYNGDYLNRVFQQETGLTITSYSQKLCMEEAARRLSNTGEPISRITKDLGYENRTYFNKLFREAYSMSPQTFRETHKMG